MRIIKLGNPHPKQYRMNPRPPDDFTLAQYEKFATTVCGLDISDIPQEGHQMRASDGMLLYEVTKSHRSAFIRDRIEKPVRIPWLGGECVTTIQISDQSTVDEAVKEIETCWRAAAEAPPSWISGTHKSMVDVVQKHFNITEVRDFQENAA